LVDGEVGHGTSVGDALPVVGEVTTLPGLAHATMSAVEPPGVTGRPSMTFRLARRDCLVRALIGSQVAILLLVAPDGSSGGNWNAGHLDTSRLVVFSVVLYVTASILGLLIGYQIFRRRALEVRPDGFSMGTRRTEWTAVSAIEVKKSGLGSRRVMANGRRLPAPASGPFRTDPGFEEDVAILRSKWEQSRAAMAASTSAFATAEAPAFGSPNVSDPSAEDESPDDSSPDAPPELGSVIFKTTAGVLAVLLLAVIVMRVAIPRSVILTPAEQRYCRIYRDTTASLKSALKSTFNGGSGAQAAPLAQSIVAERRDAAPTSELRAALSTWESFLELQQPLPSANTLADAAATADGYAEDVCGVTGDLS
jgi:hypothetical protein